MTDAKPLAEEVAAVRRDLAAGRRDEAWRAMTDLLRRFPVVPRVALEAGWTGLRCGQAPAAGAILRRLTERWPDNGSGWAVLGEALAAAGERADASAAYRRAIDLASGNPRIMTMVGLALANLNETEAAVAALRHATAAPSPSFAARACLAGLLAQRSGLAAARAEFDAAVAAMLADLRAGRFDEALTGESQLDTWVVRPVEDEAHAETCFAAWRDAMTEAGAKAAAALPPITAERRRDDDVPIVGFFLHAASLLGHVELALDYLAAIRNGAGPRLEPRLYVFAGVHDGLREQARRRGLPITFIDTEWSGGGAAQPFQKLLWLRERLARDGVSTLVWISVPHFVHFGAALGVAPINIFWALRFRPVSSPYIQGSVACASCFEREDRVNGRRWDVIPLAFQDLAGPARDDEVAAIRRRLGDPPIVFASLARREKMQGKAWLEAVGLTLKACPDAVFLWTGRSEDPRIAGALRDMGVAAQSRFVGWVDTRLYAQVLDIFLDTAPVGCGLTAMQAMAWGKPLVSFKDPLTNWGQCLAPVLDGRIADPAAKAAIEAIFALGRGRDLLAWADNPQGYAALAAKLAGDGAFRAEVGAAGRTFTARYFGSPDYAAERLATVIRATLAAHR